MFYCSDILVSDELCVFLMFMHLFVTTDLQNRSKKIDYFLILFENTSNIMYYIFMDNYIDFIAHNDIAWLYN